MGFIIPMRWQIKNIYIGAIGNEGNEQNICLYVGKCAELHFSRTSGKHNKNRVRLERLDEAFS